MSTIVARDLGQDRRQDDVRNVRPPVRRRRGTESSAPRIGRHVPRSPRAGAGRCHPQVQRQVRILTQPHGHFRQADTSIIFGGDNAGFRGAS